MILRLPSFRPATLFILAAVCPFILIPALVSAAEKPVLVILIGEKEYETAESLPVFAKANLEAHFTLAFVSADTRDGNAFPGIEALDKADVLLVSVRRRTPPTTQMQAIRRFVKAGKPVIGIRTASHAFALRKGEPPADHGDWPEFDKEVFGGNYHGHYGKKNEGPNTFVTAVADHPAGAGFGEGEIAFRSWLYQVSPLANDCTVLLTGRVPGSKDAPEPVAWVRKNRWGGRVFYTSLGHPDDFANARFQALLRDGILWAATGKTHQKHTHE